jgi:hypothetical protein
MKDTWNMKTLIFCMMFLGIVALVLGSNPTVSAGEKKLDLALCAPDQAFTIDIDNPYILYYPVGKQSTLIGEEDDETIIVRITVLDETEILYAGMPHETVTRVVEEMEAVDENEDGVIQNEEVIEQSFNYYTQRTDDDTVCYFGEEVWERPEEGEAIAVIANNNGPEPGVVVPGLVRNMDGEWRADEIGSSPGVFFPASDDAKSGTKFQQENGPPDALDEMKIVGIGSVLLEDVTIDGNEFEEFSFEDVRRGREFNPVDGDKGYKTFAYSIGIILDEDFALTVTGVLP